MNSLSSKRKIFLFITVMVLCVLLPATLIASEEAHGAGWQKNAWEMSIKIIDFAILVFFLIKFLSKPLSNYLSAKAEAIRVEIDELKSNKTAVRDILVDYDQKLKNIDNELKKAREEAQHEMKKESDLALEEARKAAQTIIDHSRETVKREFAKAKSDLHKEAVDLSLELAEGLIIKNINQRDHRRLAEDYIQKIASKQ